MQDSRVAATWPERWVTRLRITRPFEQSDVVVPGNLCKTLLHNSALWPSRCKGTHVFEVARGEASHVWKRLLEAGWALAGDEASLLFSDSMGSFLTTELLRRLYFLLECHGG